MNMKDSYTYWRDSPNTFSHVDGRLAGPPIAPLGLQAQVFDALIAAAEVVDFLPRDCRVANMPATSASLRTRADVVRRIIVDHYSVADEDGEFLADAVEVSPRTGKLAAVRVRTIDLGMVLDTGLLEGEAFRGLRHAVIRQLFGNRFLTPFGLTGRDRSDIRFGRYDYHAQVWGWAVHKVADGLRRYDYHDLADELDARVMRHSADGLYPEFVGGGPTPLLEYCPHRLVVRRPAYDGTMTTTVKERPPGPHQAWTVVAILAIDHFRRRPDRPSRAAPDVEFEREVLHTISDRAFHAIDDLRWDPSGQRLARFSGSATAIAPSPTAVEGND
jgi:glycogen debranching enzyme